MSRMDKVQANKMKIAASGKILIVKGIAAFGAEFARRRRAAGAFPRICALRCCARLRSLCLLLRAHLE